jgi:hypothetical protein
MTVDEVVRALSHMVVATPGWTDETVDEYIEQLVDLDDYESLDAACRSIARAWSDNRRPPIAIVLDSYDRERRLSARAIDPGRVHCDGSRMRWQGGRLVPCARCNPALTQVWDDPTRLREWLHGTEIEHLDVGVERVSGRLRFSDGGRPAQCFAADEEPVTSKEHAHRIMWLAYEQSLLDAGRQPDRQHFDQLIGDAQL